MAVTHCGGRRLATTSCSVHKAGYLSNPNLLLWTWKFPGESLVLSPWQKPGNSGSDHNDGSGSNNNRVSQLCGKRWDLADRGGVQFLLPRPFSLNCVLKMSLTTEVGLLVSTKVNRTVLWVGLYSDDSSLWQADNKVNIGLSATKLPLQPLQFNNCNFRRFGTGL